MPRFLLIPLIAFAGTPAVIAQQLTLDEAVREAVRGSPAVHAAEAEAEAMATRARNAQGHRRPTLDLSEVFSYTDNPAEVFALTLNQGRFDFDKFFNSDPNKPDPLSTWITRLELTQAIYTGGKLAARIGQAQAAAAAAECGRDHIHQEVAFETVTAFVNLHKARERAALLATARDTTAEHLRLAEAYAGQGLILEADVLKARVFLAEMEELLSQADNDARLAEASLNFQLGAHQGTPRVLAPLPPAPPISGAVEEWLTAAEEDRRDLAASRQRLEAGRLETRAARSSRLPEIAAVGHYDLYDDTIFGNHGHSGGVMAVAKINLYRGGSNRAAVRSARHESAAFEHHLRRFSEGIRLEVEQAWQNLRTARARQTTATGSLTAAREALRVREQRFRQGLDRMIDLQDAETALREAELRELVARYDVALGSYRLIFVSGGTLVPSTEESS